MNLINKFADAVEKLRVAGQYRQLQATRHDGVYIESKQGRLLNLSGNDYLGVAGSQLLREQFFEAKGTHYALGSGSSRLLTGNEDIMSLLETKLGIAYGDRAALLFNSGYHANSGILPALVDRKTVILADKLIHASLIDGMRLSATRFIRYRHNDLNHLQQLIEQYADSADIDCIVVVTESVFSMDGDIADLRQLVSLKQLSPKIILYVDEAHAVGVFGQQGLGLAESQGVMAEVDILVGTFGKALASMGAFAICHPVLREYLINTARPLIFSTALSPLNWAWSDFVWTRVLTMQQERQCLQELSHRVRQQVLQFSPHCSASHIVPVIVGDSERAVAKASQLADAGFAVMAVRPPTVPANSARLRISLNSKLQWQQLKPMWGLLMDDHYA